MRLPPLSPHPGPDGTRFRIVSAHPPRLRIGRRTHPAEDRGEFWEVFVPGAGPGTEYHWLVDGHPPLLDPCALAVAGEAPRLRAVVVAPEPVSWERPATALRDSVLYELHVRGYTRHESANNPFPGTYLGLIDRIGYLRNLGVTAVELMPVHEFPAVEQGRTNFWGYSPAAWFAPNRRYSHGVDPIAEFRTMVRAFHAEGLQVIIDAVFNHTAELDGSGPTLHFRALDPEGYYLPGNYSGCGNAVSANAPAGQSLILDAMRWWVEGLGVDGFRFDLATVLTRDPEGHELIEPPILKAIEEDPVLGQVHLIAEAWDAGGGYQVGRWPGDSRWTVWNDRFRDDVRRAWLGHAENGGVLATRLSGSEDLFGEAGAGPRRGVNFITAHDGFTLKDLVSYSRRHNEANGENNHDGHGHEVSHNHGVEGATGVPAIRAARDRARRNLIASLLLAQGVPMLTAGDEFGRTQGGNNNPYCHDSDLTWIDWTGLEQDRGFCEFVRALIRLRRETPALRRAEFLTGREVRWFAPDGGAIDWGDGVFGYEYAGALLVLVNLSDAPEAFEVDKGWSLAADTSGSAPVMAPRSLAVYTATDDLGS